MKTISGMRQTIIGISGGIGSGKSVVSRILREFGHEVIDCDYEAKRLMAESSEIKCAIRDRISAEVTDGIKEPDRKLLSKIVFSNESARLELNAIVHECLKEHIRREMYAHPGHLLFIEAALLAESGLAEECDVIWRVHADPKERVDRICRRDGCSPAMAVSKIRSQQREASLGTVYDNKTEIIFNTKDKSLMQQVNNLIDKLNY